MSLEERIIVRLYDEEKCFGPGMEELLVKQDRSYQQDLAAYAHTRFPEYFRAFLSEEAAAPPTDGKEKTPC